MLKKAGIMVAIAATGVLAVSSLAFADEEMDNTMNDCSFANAGGEVAQDLTGGTSGSLVDLVGAVTGTATNATTQANTGNCTNAVTRDVTDTASNNKTETITKTRTEDSFNTED